MPPLAALLVALFFAVLSTRIHFPKPNPEGAAVANRPTISSPVVEPPQTLLELLARFAYGVDVLAVLGLGAVLVVRSMQRRGGNA